MKWCGRHTPYCQDVIFPQDRLRLITIAVRICRFLYNGPVATCIGSATSSAAPSLLRSVSEFRSTSPLIVNNTVAHKRGQHMLWLHKRRHCIAGMAKTAHFSAILVCFALYVGQTSTVSGEVTSLCHSGTWRREKTSVCVRLGLQTDVMDLTCPVTDFTLSTQDLLKVPPCAAEFKRGVLNGALPPCVENLQKGLKLLKTPGLVVDGLFGENTESSVKFFQRTEGLVGKSY